MYLDYFNLAEEPFGATPNPRFLVPTSSHREALASLHCGFLSNRGFTVLIAEPGMGKTTLLNAFLSQIDDRARTVFLFNTLSEPKEVVTSILADLGVAPASLENERHHQLNSILIKEARAGRRLVVIIDEAQNLSNRVLEAVRQLTNFETVNAKLMQVVLAGQPHLADKLASPQLMQLRQRISTVCHLAPLSALDTAAYIDRRLKLSGWAGGKLFTNSAIQLIADASNGIPRNINTLCFNSLCLCRAQKEAVVDRASVAEAIKDLQLFGDESLRRSKGQRRQVRSLNSGSRFLRNWRTLALSTATVLVFAVACLGLFFQKAKAGAQSKAKSSAANLVDRSTMPSVLFPNPRVGIKDGAEANKAVNERVTYAASPIEITIKSGDTLEAVARSRLGTFNQNLSKQIQVLNPRIMNPDHIETGTVLRLPNTQIGQQNTP